MKGFFAYTRVSTTKQGTQGVSLQEQREIIRRFAEHQGLTVCAWYEEQQTAAKRGRPVFTQLLQRLRRGEAAGLIVHKIDRGARNLRDWADLGDLIDSGVKVHFASDGLDLDTRGGRLSADIQAVVAADYIRNLREETRKGFYGRLKQGLYPLRAPLGYLDSGGGKPKVLDPLKAPLIRLAYELYATGQYTLKTLVEEMNSRGLRTRTGAKVVLNTLSVILNDPFYCGVIKIKRRQETFIGVHEPIIKRPLFDRVQGILHGRLRVRRHFHRYLFRRLWVCERCGRTLIAESQKGHVYYRCQTRGCLTKCLREEVLEQIVFMALEPVRLDLALLGCIHQYIASLRQDQVKLVEAQRETQRVRQGQIRDRLNRLTDALLDGLIEKEVFAQKRAALLLDQNEAIQSQPRTTSLLDRAEEFLELAKDPCLLYELAFPDEKRELLLATTSNRTVDQENGSVELSEPFRSIVAQKDVLYCGPRPDGPRTAKVIVDFLMEWLREHSEASFDLAENARKRQAA